MADKKSMPKFVNVKIPELVWDEVVSEIPQQATDLLLAFIDVASEGVKISFSYRDAQSAYTCAVTLPALDKEEKGQCATFWANDLWYCLAEAYVATFLFKATEIGFERASERMQNRSQIILEEVRAFKQANKKK